MKKRRWAQEDEQKEEVRNSRKEERGDMSTRSVRAAPIAKCVPHRMARQNPAAAALAPGTP
eukprot:7105443-Pyramimonas_sp.AAC.1